MKRFRQKLTLWLRTFSRTPKPPCGEPRSAPKLLPQQLTVEQANRVLLGLGWMTTDQMGELFRFLALPEPLEPPEWASNLSQEQWMAVGLLLASLMYQREHSPLH